MAKRIFAFKMTEDQFSRLQKVTKKRQFMNDSETIRWMISEMCIKELKLK